MKRKVRSHLLLSAAVLAMVLAGCGSRSTARPAFASAPTPVSAPAKLIWNGRYAEHVQPIFDRYCVSCHGPDRAENGLRLTRHEEVMRGTRYGPVVEAGSPARSTLISVVEGKADMSIRMPFRERRLSEPELQTLVLWIEAGAPAE